MLANWCKFVLAAAFVIGTTDAQYVQGKRAVNSHFCTTVNQQVTSARQQSSATAFCSSYLSLTSAVTTKTVSTKTVVARTSTITSTTTVTSGDGGTTTLTVTSSSGVTTVTQSTCPAQKRTAAATTPEPSALKPYPSGPTLTRACNCLSIPETTSTSSIVATTTTTPKKTITSTKTVQATTVVTKSTTVVVPSSTATTNIPPSTCTTTQPAPTDYVVNGGFEDGDDGVWLKSAQSGDTSEITQSTQPGDPSAPSPPEGPHNGDWYSLMSVALSGSSQASVGQILTGLSSTQSYTLTFWYRQYVEDDNPFCTLRVTYAGNTVYLLSPTPNDSSGNTYQQVSTPIAAPASSGSLSFIAACDEADANGSFIVQIDDVSLVQST